MSLHCPACPNESLVPTRLEPELPAAGCLRCGGALLALVGWRHWRERHRAPFAAPRGAAAAPSRADDNRGALRCPKCAAFMAKYGFAADSTHQIDHCAHCDEVWLDRGEWELLERFDLDGELGRVISRPFQARLRTEEARQRQEARYREQFGDEYARIAALREWLAGHARGREILAYLYLSQTDERR